MLLSMLVKQNTQQSIRTLYVTRTMQIMCFSH